MVHLLRRPVVVLAVVVVVAALVVAGATLASRSGAGPGVAAGQELRLEVPVGPGRPGTVSLDATLYLPARTPAPAVLVAHGFGGSKRTVDADARDLARRGFVALAWSARGFGASTGQIALDSPDAEVADGSRLLDYLATRPEVVLDRPGDPRVGVTGASYGGALALLLAGYDRRVDALAPLITWNDLGQALFPNAASVPAPPEDTPARTAFGPDGVFKRGWASLFFAAGRPRPPGAGQDAAGGGSIGDRSPTGDDAVEAGRNPPDGATADGATADGATADGATPDGATADGATADAAAPTGPPFGAGHTGDGHTGGGPAADATCGRFEPEFCAAYTRDAVSGRLDPATAALLRRSSPASVADRITAPTLLVQGEADTLFGLDQADATARQIAGAGGRVRVLWFSGGHDAGAPDGPVRDEIGAWFRRYLAAGPGAPDSGADPGGLSYAVPSGIRTRGRAARPTRMITADRYPGLHGDPVRRQALPLRGPARDVLNPPGGYPAAITTLPGVSGPLGNLAGRLAALGTDLPGQTAEFGTDPVTNQVLVAGASRVRITVARVPGQPTAPDAVLFARLVELSPDGRRENLGGAVAPMRVPVPTGATEVTVTLPAVVAPVEPGHRLVVSVATTDQGYQGPVAPSVWRVGLAGDAALEVPVVPGRAATPNTVPRGPALGIVGVLTAAAVAALVARWRRRAERRPALVGGLPLVVAGVAKHYPGGITAVHDATFEVRPNEVVGLLGPNGAGKTTVLRMLMGLLSPSAGELRVFGHPVVAGAPVLSRVGSFVEGPGFLPHLTGIANLRLYWAATGRPAADADLEECLRIADLGAAAHRPVRTYSQGMRQRLAIAQAMLGRPDLLVLDEPTNGLDPPQIHAMREVLRRYARDGRAVLVSSHLLAEVERSCDRVVVMARGRVVAQGPVAQVAADAQGSRRQLEEAFLELVGEEVAP